ncbi:MAG: hypothetical protein KGZ83_07995 [Sulfuricella sp.]|nr:hypothetical protein [Sulfuricella sp.]
MNPAAASSFPEAQLPAVDPQFMAQALGVPLYQPPYFMPEYAVGEQGKWKMIKGGFLLDRGYYSGVWGVSGLPALLRTSLGDGQGWDTWMSLSPHEIESQELAVRYAHGHSVVMGLGMGWVAANVALNPAVSKVTVIERDPEVIDLFSRVQNFAGLPAEARAKLNLVEADALFWQPGEPVDFLYADIWRTLEEPQTLDDVRAMQANVAANEVYFWGQELFIHKLATPGPQDAAGPEQWAESVARCVRECIALPLLMPSDFDYPALIAQIVKQRRQFPSS